jgi:hypothetical protein
MIIFWQRVVDVMTFFYPLFLKNQAFPSLVSVYGSLFPHFQTCENGVMKEVLCQRVVEKVVSMKNHKKNT